MLGSESYRKNCITQRIFNSTDLRVILLDMCTGTFVYPKMPRSIADSLHPSAWIEFYFWLIRCTNRGVARNLMRLLCQAEGL